MIHIIKQNRKTASIKVDKYLNVIVTVPKYMSKKDIDQFIEKYETWIHKTLEKRKVASEEYDWFKTKKILYLGEYIEVEIKQSSYGKDLVVLTEKGLKIISKGEEESIRKAVEAFYRKKAKVILEELTHRYATLIGVSYNKITIRKQETRWGSCSSKGNLSYNVRMLCAPMEMIEYVVLHEVMHLRHFNHSSAFWQDLECIMPDYKRRMNYFKESGQNFII